MQFQKDKMATIQALINSGSKINAMTLAYAEKLRFQIQRNYIGAQNIDGSSLNTFEIVIADFFGPRYAG